MAPTGRPPRPTLGPSAFLESGGAARKGGDREKTPGQAEASFFQRLVDAAHPIRLKLRDGTDFVGTLAWYDRGAVRVDLAEGGHRVVPKAALACIERLPEAGGS